MSKDDYANYDFHHKHRFHFNSSHTLLCIQLLQFLHAGFHASFDYLQIMNLLKHYFCVHNYALCDRGYYDYAPSDDRDYAHFLCYHDYDCIFCHYYEYALNHDFCKNEVFRYAHDYAHAHEDFTRQAPR